MRTTVGSCGWGFSASLEVESISGEREERVKSRAANSRRGTGIKALDQARSKLGTGLRVKRDAVAVPFWDLKAKHPNCRTVYMAGESLKGFSEVAWNPASIVVPCSSADQVPPSHHFQSPPQQRSPSSQKRSGISTTVNSSNISNVYLLQITVPFHLDLAAH